MTGENVDLNRDRTRERGSIIVMTAVLMVGLVLAIGLAIDVARIFSARAELQNAADAAALAAARELNSGSTGIDDAVARAMAIVNSKGFNDAPVSIANVQFAADLDGTYMNQAAARNAASTIRFVRVTTQPETLAVLFAARAIGTDHAETAVATAGMSIGLNGICDFFPIAVALINPNPAPGTLMNLTFVQGSGNAATLDNFNYIVLEVPDINGNGAPETAVLTAGFTSICKSLGGPITFRMTPSANINNGPRQMQDGLNTRFNLYANGYGNALTPTNYPPDSNVNENISHLQYKSGSPSTSPNPNAPGVDGRRILVAPIVAPGTYSPPTTNIVKWGAFFVRRRTSTQNPCSQAGNVCARLEVEYLGDDFVIGRGYYDPNGQSSNLTIAVLYK